MSENLELGDVFEFDCGDRDSLRGRGMEGNHTYDIGFAEDCTVVAMEMGRATCVVWVQGELVVFEMEEYEVSVTGKDLSMPTWWIEQNQK